MWPGSLSEAQMLPDLPAPCFVFAFCAQANANRKDNATDEFVGLFNA
jgi:hypothetical protein